MSGYFEYTRKAWDKKVAWPNSQGSRPNGWLVGLGVGIIAIGIAVIAASAVIALLSPPGLFVFGTILAAMVGSMAAEAVGGVYLNLLPNLLLKQRLRLALLL